MQKKKFIFFKCLCFLILFGVSQQGFAQNETFKVSGVVWDQQFDEPIIGASVRLKGTNVGSITDSNGKFSFDGKIGDVIEVTYIGYQPTEVKIVDKQPMKILLNSQSITTEEFIVVGYGVQRKSDVTGSIGVSKGEDMMKQQSFGALDGLKGKVSGVNIFSNSGAPGSSPKVVIRGKSTINASSDPLYVVDGVVMEDFSSVNPNDIERMEVLKDASSTAIYGARGANGVILVTTKKGFTDGDGTPVISYNGSLSIGTMAKYMDVMNSDQWIDAFMIGQSNANKYYGRNYSLNKTDYFNDPRYFTSTGDPIYNTDWQKEATRTTFSQNHQINIQQGSQKSSIGAFLNYSDYQGLLLNTYMKRVNMKLNYEARPSKYITTNTSIMVNHLWGNETDIESGAQVPKRTMLEMLPWLPVYSSDGAWINAQNSPSTFGAESMANPVHVLKTQQRKRFKTQIFGNIGVTFNILDNLSLRTQFGVDAHLNKNRNYAPNDLVDLSYPDGEASVRDTDILYWQEETYLNYHNTIGDHRFTGMLGLSWQERTYRYNSVVTKGFIDNFYGYDNLGVGTKYQKPSSEYQNWSMNSYFLRGTYSFKDRYSATVTGRIDGSSRFGKDKKYGVFPSLGLAWIFSEEDFMKNCEFLNNGKLHASYGVTGNTEIGTYKSLSMMSTGTVVIGGVNVPSANIGNLGNSDLKWEKTHQFDLGLDLGFFQNRLNLDVSFYKKTTKDLIMERPIPDLTGFSSVLQNIGQVTNKGIDLMITTVNMKTDEFRWSTTLNFNYNKNKIDKLGENNEDIFPGPDFLSGSNTILRVGESLGSFWGYERLGIYTEEDASAGLIPKGSAVGQAKRSSEKKILGNGMPKWTGSFINTFNYKEFDFTLDMQFVMGVDVLQQFYHSLEDRFGYSNGLTTILKDGWTTSNQHTNVQAIRNASTNGQSTDIDSRWVASGSYLRANLIQLGYTFKDKTLSKTPISKLRVYFGVNNAFLISSKNFRGYDPEATSHDNQFGQNIFFYQYPKPRTFTLGLSCTF